MVIMIGETHDALAHALAMRLAQHECIIMINDVTPTEPKPIFPLINIPIIEYSFIADEINPHFWLSHSRAFLHKWRKLFCRQHLPRRHYLHRLRGSYVHLARVHPT